MRVLVDGMEGGTVAAGDRGLAYGDGLFETMRAHAGTVPWWPAHWRRLLHGAQRLCIPVPAEADVVRQVATVLKGGEGVVKLLLTRGAGGRGYAPPPEPAPTCIVSHHPVPVATPGGLTLRWCETRLAEQPALAGIKHCNRLEQVLARLEWTAPGCPMPDADDGLMRATSGDVVCATSANVFALIDGQWRTPPVDGCGVAGVCREWALARLEARIETLSPQHVESADAVFLCNAVRGILPVARLGDRTWSPHPRVAAARRALALDHPAFAAPPETP